MNLDILDRYFQALTVLGGATCHIEWPWSQYEHPSTKLRINWNNEPFLLMFSTDNEVVKYWLKSADAAHKKLIHLLDVSEKLGKYSVVEDFFVGWDPAMRKEYIRCCSEDDLLCLTFIRFYADGRKKFKTICKILDRKIKELKNGRKNQKVS